MFYMHYFVMNLIEPNNFTLTFLVSKCLRLKIAWYMLWPIGNVVKGKTLRIYSQNVDNQHVTLKVACRATEPVELKFINFIRILREVKETKNFSQEFPHTVRIKLNVEWFRGNTSVVECITKRDRRVIKTWKFLKHGRFILNNRTFKAHLVNIYHRYGWHFLPGFYLHNCRFTDTWRCGEWRYAQCTSVSSVSERPGLPMLFQP